MTPPTGRRPLLLLALALAPLIATAGGCATDKSVISNAAAANDQLKPAIITDPQLAGYIQQIGDRIIVAAKVYDAHGLGPDTHKSGGDSQWMFTNDMRFHLVNSKTVNAFTTGGEHMYIYTALLNLCKNEDELAAVMAHEFAHVYSRHVQKGTNRSTGMQVFALAGTGAGYALGGKDNGGTYAQTLGGGAAALAQFAGMSFTRGDEAQADEWGFKFYCQAGYDPDQFADFFKAMIAAGYDTTPAMASDHPTLASRVAAAQDHVATWHKFHPGGNTQKPPIDDPAQFAAFKQRVAEVTASLPDDKAVQKAQTLLASFNSCVAPVEQPQQAAVRRELLIQSDPNAPVGPPLP